MPAGSRQWAGDQAGHMCSRAWWFTCLGMCVGQGTKRGACGSSKRRRRPTGAEEMSLNRRSSTLPLALPQIRARAMPQIDKPSNLPLSPPSNTLPAALTCLGLPCCCCPRPASSPVWPRPCHAAANHASTAAAVVQHAAASNLRNTPTVWSHACGCIGEQASGTVQFK